MAQEVLNSNERVLYTVLWNKKDGEIDPQNPHIRTVRAGYEFLAKQTNLAKKTIQRLIPRLMQKDFIQVEQTPNFYNRTAASYRVFSYKHVLDAAAQQGRTHIAKLGHGIAFVRQYQNPLPTKNRSPLTTVPSVPLSTVVRKSMVSVPSAPLSTVVRKSTILESSTVRNRETTSPPPELFERLETLIPEIDTGAVERIWREGREVVADLQPEEIAYWFEQRAKLVYQNRTLKNPLGLLLSSIKDWLTERKVVTRRNQLRELAEEEQRIRKQLDEDQSQNELNEGRDTG
jgi:predicted transcriptional regulator